MYQGHSLGQVLVQKLSPSLNVCMGEASPCPVFSLLALQPGWSALGQASVLLAMFFLWSQAWDLGCHRLQTCRAPLPWVMCRFGVLLGSRLILVNLPALKGAVLRMT